MRRKTPSTRCKPTVAAVPIKAPTGWSADEDNRLRDAVFRHGGKKWKAIAATLPQRTPADCNARWNALQNLDDAVKSAWTAPEDARMNELVATYGPGRWAVIASCLPGRNGKQCRERWHNQLNPAIKKDSWTADEDRMIIALQATLGNAWAKIAEHLDGRTDNAVKNRWHSSLTKSVVRRPRRHTPKSSSASSSRARRVRRSTRSATPSAKKKPRKQSSSNGTVDSSGDIRSGSGSGEVASPTAVDMVALYASSVRASTASPGAAGSGSSGQQTHRLTAAADAATHSLTGGDADTDIVKIEDDLQREEDTSVVRLGGYSPGMMALLTSDNTAMEPSCDSFERFSFSHCGFSSALVSPPTPSVSAALFTSMSSSSSSLFMKDEASTDDFGALATSAIADCLLMTPSYALDEPALAASLSCDTSESLVAPLQLKQEVESEDDQLLFASVWRGTSAAAALYPVATANAAAAPLSSLAVEHRFAASPMPLALHELESALAPDASLLFSDSSGSPVPSDDASCSDGIVLL